MNAQCQVSNLGPKWISPKVRKFNFIGGSEFDNSLWSQSTIYTLCVPLGPKVDAIVKMRNEPKMNFLCQKYIFHMLYGAFQITPRIVSNPVHRTSIFTKALLYFKLNRWADKTKKWWTLTITFRLNYGPKQILRASFPIHTRLWKTKTVTIHY